MWDETPGGGGGVVQISSEGDDRRIFLSLKLLIPGIFFVGKFGKYVFGWLDLSRFCFGYWNYLKIRGSALVSRPRSLCIPDVDKFRWYEELGFYLGFIIWWRSLEWPKATSSQGRSGGIPPEIFLNKYVLRCKSGAFWDTILSYSVLIQGEIFSYALTSARLDDFSDIVTYIL